METCPDEGGWIRLLTGDLEAVERARLHDHLQSCLECRRQYEELQATRETLRSIRWDSPERDLVAAVRAAAMREQLRPALFRVSQAAAVILLAAGVGLVAGRLVTSGRNAQTLPTEVSTEELVQSIGLDALDDGAVLSRLFADEASGDADGEEVPS
jgi:anti-sigma factor RsiW